MEHHQTPHGKPEKHFHRKWVKICNGDMLDNLQTKTHK